MSSIPPPEALKEFFGATTRHTRRVEIYEQDGITRWAKDTTLRLKDGSVNVDYERDERRSLDLVLDNSDGVLRSAPGELWYDKVIKVFRGVRINQPARVPKVLVLSDKAGERQLAPSFRATLVSMGYGDVRVNTIAADYAVDVEPYDIIVGLGAATALQVDLLRQAYLDGKSVFVQDADAADWIAAAYPTANGVLETGMLVAPASNSTHPASKGWTGFRPKLGRLWNKIHNPSFTASATSSWNVGSVTGATVTVEQIATGGVDGGPFRRTNFENVSSSTFPYIIHTYVDVNDSGPWTASFYVKSDTVASTRLRIWWYSATGVGSGASTNSDVIQLTNSWQRVHVTATPPPGTTLARVSTQNDGTDFPAGVSRIDLDQVMLTEGEVLYDYFDSETPDTAEVTYSYDGGNIAQYNDYLSYTPVGNNWTLVAPSTADPTRAVVSAFRDPTRGGRAVAFSFPINYQQYDDDQFKSLVTNSFQWLNTVQPITVWETQIGEFVIDRISEPNFPHDVKITGRDYTKTCMLSKFPFATQFAEGLALESLIGAIAGAAGITKRSLPATGVVVGRTFFFERGVSRWEAIKEIATAYNHEVFFDATGYLVMRPFNDPATSVPSIYIETGKAGQVASYEKSTTDTRIFNHILVTGESSEEGVTPVYAERRNEDPNSPTNINELGDRFMEYSSAFIETQAQADELADSFLAVYALEEFDLSFESLMMPWLDAGEILGWIDPNPAPGDPTTFLLSSLTLPLGLGAMSGVGRRVTNVGVNP